MWLSEINKNNITKDIREETAILCYKIPIQLVNQHSFEGGVRLLKSVYINCRSINNLKRSIIVMLRGDY